MTNHRRDTLMGTALPIDKLTKKELGALAKAAGVDDVDLKKNKDEIVKALRKGGVTDEQFRDALIDAEHIEADPPFDNDTTDTTDQDAQDAADDAAAKAALAAASKPTKSTDDGVDLDTWEPAGGDVAQVDPNREALPELEEEDLPVLERLGASVRRITKITRHPGQMGETWHCPWSDFSRLSGGPLSAGLDQVPQSGAIRVGRFAVILPPAGIDVDAFKRARKRR